MEKCFLCRCFGGLIDDIKRKLPHYKSDFSDAFNIQCFATFITMYFALLAPIVTFGGLLDDATFSALVSECRHLQTQGSILSGRYGEFNRCSHLRYNIRVVLWPAIDNHLPDSASVDL